MYAYAMDPRNLEGYNQTGTPHVLDIVLLSRFVCSLRLFCWCAALYSVFLCMKPRLKLLVTEGQFAFFFYPRCARQFVECTVLRLPFIHSLYRGDGDDCVPPNHMLVVTGRAAQIRIIYYTLPYFQTHTDTHTLVDSRTFWIQQFKANLFSSYDY